MKNFVVYGCVRWAYVKHLNEVITQDHFYKQ